MVGGTRSGQNLAYTYDDLFDIPTSLFPTSITALDSALAEAGGFQQGVLPPGTCFAASVREIFHRSAKVKTQQRAELIKQQSERLAQAREDRLLRKQERASHAAALRSAAMRESERKASRERELERYGQTARLAAENARRSELKHREQIAEARAEGEREAAFQRACKASEDALQTERSDMPSISRSVAGAPAPSRRPPRIRPHDAPARARVTKNARLLKQNRSRAASKACLALQDAKTHLTTLSRVPWPDSNTAQRIGNGQKFLAEAVRELNYLLKEV